MDNQKGYTITDQAAVHFITFTVVGWIDARLTGRAGFHKERIQRHSIRKYSSLPKRKRLILYAWCVMTNHVHLIVSAKDSNLSDILRDFKKFTGKQLISAIQNNSQESRRECPPDLTGRDARYLQKRR